MPSQVIGHDPVVPLLSPSRSSALALRPLTPEDEPQARAACAELGHERFDFLPGLVDARDFADYLHVLARDHAGIDLPPDAVPATLLAGFVGADLVGRVSVRHRLDNRLSRVGGHIGYAVRPAFRGNGHATEMLRQALRAAAGLGIEKAFLTCDDTNLASIAVIERCGGELQDVFVDESHPVPKRRYWVPTAR